MQEAEDTSLHKFSEMEELAPQLVDKKGNSKDLALGPGFASRSTIS